MYILIPLGGKGERFSKNGYKNPKPLIKVFDKEIICYLLDHLMTCIDKQTDSVYIIYNNDLESFNFSSFIKNKYPIINLIKLNHQTKGAAETINIGIKEIKNSKNYNPKNGCLILDGDTFYTTNIINKAKIINENAVFYFKELDTASSNPLYSYISLNSNKIIDIQEKIKISDNANVGAYYFKSIENLLKYTNYIITHNITFNNEFYVSCVVKSMLNNNKIFYGIQLSPETFYSLGTPSQVTSYINKTYAFLFDLDGTLILSDNLYYKIWIELLNNYNITLTRELFNNYISGNNDETALKLLIPNITDYMIQSITLKKDSLFIKYIYEIELIDGALDFIKNIKLNGHKICIVTNCSRDVAEKIISFFEFDNYMDYLIIGNECSKPKPYPDPYIKALELLNISNKKAVIFEDSRSGVLSAKGSYPLSLVGIESSIDSKTLSNLGVNLSIKDYVSINLDNIINSFNHELTDLTTVVKNNLSIKYEIESVVIDDKKLKGGFIADIVQLFVYLKSGEMLNCVLKLENNNETLLKNMAKQLHLYDREYYFYNVISDYLNIKIPKFYLTIKDSDFKSTGILLENLNNDSFILNLDLNNNPINVSLTVIDRIAKMHSKFWNKNLEIAFDKLKKPNDPSFCPSMSNFVKENWPKFKLKWSNVLSQKQFEIGDVIVHYFNGIQNYLSDENLTLCHGDLKSANIFYKKLNDDSVERDIQFEPYFIDWQYINHGKGVSDIVFFIIESFDILSINKFNDLFQEYYYVKLLEHGVENYSKESYLYDFKISSCFYPFFVAIWFGVISQEDLIDVNFPFFYIQKLFYFLEKNECISSFLF